MTLSSLKKLMEPAESSLTSNVLSLWKNKETWWRGGGGGGDDGVSICGSPM